jgi:hypothetical protein
VTRQQVGWGLVVLAGVLLLAQLVPVLTGAHPTAARNRVAAPVELGPTSAPTHGTLPATFRPNRLAPTEEAVMVDRRADGREVNLVGWQGAPEGTIQLPPGETAGWGFTQSPDGARLLDGTLFLDIDGRTSDLSNMMVQPKVSSFTWRDDSAGACALQDEGEGTTSLIEFIFNPGQVQLLRFNLPPEFAIGGQVSPRVLSCSRSQRTIVLGEVGLRGQVGLLVVDLVTGATLGRRDYPAGSAATIAGSPDGKLLALNSGRAQGWQTGPLPHTVVRSIGDGAVVRDFGTDTLVRTFSADSTEVLVDSPTHAGAAVRRLSDGGVVWTDNSSRQLLGWLARPLSHSFAVALGSRDNNTCTRGEPGKFPQFCHFQKQQDLVLVADTGSARSIDRGLGAWGYDIP